MKTDAKLLYLMQKHLGYTDEEMKLFKENPANHEILAQVPKLLNKTIIFEVIESHGCNSQHKVGDKFYFDGAGNLITKLSPKKICAFALHPCAGAIFAVDEFIYEGMDPNRIKFNNVCCSDVGVRCGGWGHIVMRFRVEDRK